MKKNLFLIIAIIFTFCFAVHAQKTPQLSVIRVMSYNIKFDDKADTLNGWKQRREKLTNLIAFYEPDFIGTQEALLHQLQYMQKHLEHMKWIGKGRTDGKKKGEFSAIFYNADLFAPVAGSDSTMWLSETPSKPGKGWDASYIRILTWAKFENLKTHSTVYVFNTHLDNDGKKAREESTKLIQKTITKIAGTSSIILMGDFNSTPDDLPHHIITHSPANLKDTYSNSKLPPVGPSFSYEGFATLGQKDKRKIDYIFVSRQTKVLKTAIISDFNDGRYPSDHLPVIADIVF